ncbi:GH3 auxin-responsive promoter family protein [Mucilaginibacter sp. Bleaf8]|uniref:GH3 family domain-containing protein n=1 Tax=Mucilaginibacter sp. Bleaf8 TaxID=2834430 RepID=UPI001BCC3204|nr:GH3 auxin-responsive promoter family protein [Mucilaginibacter sp. Bleaf8]MBS7565751.1 GH3 auxin-responsive promoter family protein [Mucilaginibacter sp. Bleaf8]
MAIIGELLKTAIEFTDKFIKEPDPVQAQQEVLHQLLTKAQNTAFGKHYDFEKILSNPDIAQAFARTVPVFDYDGLEREWWHRVVAGENDITWPGATRYLALSSGTTSHSKTIPVTDDMLDAIRRSGMQQVAALAHFNLPATFYGKEILMLGSSTALKDINGHLAGEISGISASNIPSWFEGYYRPGKEIASISDFDERVKEIAKQAPNWDIGGLSGIPAWIELMLKEVIRYHGLKNIHEIWPNLTVYTTGGVAFEPYRKSLEKLLAYPLVYIDTYLASEGFLAMQKRPDTSAMALVVDNGIYFEFVPFEEQYITEDGGVVPDAKVIGLADVEENKDYVLLISTVSGTWRYAIGDTVMFTDKSRCEIKISGRTKQFLNVAGSQLSVIQMNAGIQEIQNRFNIAIHEFIVATIHRGEELIDRWYISTDKEVDRAEVAQALDQYLKDNNKNYAVARTRALKDVEVVTVPVEHFYKWSEEKKKLGGQVKIPRVMKEEQFLEWEDFVKHLS